MTLEKIHGNSPIDSPSPSTLVHDIAHAALKISEVIRLEPGMKDLLRKASPALLRNSAASEHHDGVSVTTFGTVTDVVIDASVKTSRQAVTTAAQIQAAVTALLRERHRQVGRIEVNILAVEYDETT